MTCFSFDLPFPFVVKVFGDELNILKFGTLTSELNELSTHPGDLRNRFLVKNKEYKIRFTFDRKNCRIQDRTCLNYCQNLHFSFLQQWTWFYLKDRVVRALGSKENLQAEEIDSLRLEVLT